MNSTVSGTNTSQKIFTLGYMDFMAIAIYMICLCSTLFYIRAFLGPDLSHWVKIGRSPYLVPDLKLTTDVFNTFLKAYYAFLNLP